MKHSIVKESEGSTLVLQGDLSIESAGAVKEALQEAMEQAESLAVDLSGFDSGDLSFLQLLCSAHRASVQNNKKLSISKQSDAFKHLVVAAGFCRAKGCTEVSAENCLWIGGSEDG